MRDFVTDVEELVRKVVDVPGRGSRCRAQQGGGRDNQGAREVVENGTDSVRSETRAGADVADEYVRGYPWAAVGVAIGIGVLLGFSSRR